MSRVQDRGHVPAYCETAPGELTWSPAPTFSSSLSTWTPPAMSGLCCSSATIRFSVLWSKPRGTRQQNCNIPNIPATAACFSCQFYICSNMLFVNDRLRLRPHTCATALPYPQSYPSVHLIKYEAFPDFQSCYQDSFKEPLLISANLFI